MAKIETLAAIRFGYGLPLPKGAARDAGEILQALAQPDRAVDQWPIFSTAEWVTMAEELPKANKAAGSGGASDRKDKIIKRLVQFDDLAAKASFARALGNQDGFRERLVTFWVDHFSVSLAGRATKLLGYQMVDQAIRPNMTGKFAALLTAVTLHPAMLTYLNQLGSVGPSSKIGRKQGKGLNENLAREVMELHSLGVGAAYSQADVTQLAKLLTGITYSPEAGVGFSEQRAEPGDETVLGITYGGKGMEPIQNALSDFAHRPETGTHIARKLAIHFVSDDPDPDLVATIAAAFNNSGGDLTATYAALLGHRAAWVPLTPKVRQPFDFLIAASRAMGVSADDITGMKTPRFRRFYLTVLEQLGQSFRSPDGPNGFPEAAEAWVTPPGLAGRISWAMQSPGRLVKQMPDPVAFARTALDDRASDDLLWAAERAEDRDQGVGLVLASAEFNRR